MFVDTSFCVDLMRERRRRVTGPATGKLALLGSVRLYASVFVACELHAWARLSSRPDHEICIVEKLLRFLEVVTPDRTLSVAYGEAEAYLRKKGKPIPTMDLLIGVTAKMHGMPLIARKELHFRQIPGLVVDEY